MAIVKDATFEGTDLKIPNWNTNQRPSNPLEGTFGYNTTTNKLEVYNGTLWHEQGITVASGGTESTFTIDEVNFKAHTFTTSGNFNMSTSGYIDILVVAGGGGGGGVPQNPTLNEQCGGGGGGGGIILKHQYFISAGVYSIVVGAGGGNIIGLPSARKGGNSTFASLIAIGGGPGGSVGENGGQGGCGGGAGYSNGGLIGGTSIQGQMGGSSSNGYNTQSYGQGGGGGGFSAIGGGGRFLNAFNPTGQYGNGGSGLRVHFTSNITVYYSGGGGAGCTIGNDYSGGKGGLGGAGNGGRYIADTNFINGRNGTANTGGGGGGGAWFFNGSTGGNGGSGIVIIRYRV
jgi:hypothetical protein